MDGYKYHTPYDCRELTLEQKDAFCRQAKKLSYNWWVDKLDCNESFHRQQVEMEFDEIMQKLESDSHFFVLHRHHDPREYVEIGFRTNGKLNEPDFFLWIQLKPEKLPKLTEEFNLSEYQK